MCGLVAVGGTFNQEKSDFFRTLLYLSGLRGKDGTGVCSFRVKHRKKNESRLTFTLSKSASAVSEFIDDNGAVVRNTDFLQIAHCRAATRGAVNDENCQPFAFEKIVGMHNGTIYGASASDGMSDSYHLLKAIDKGGLAEGVEKIGHGSAALIWVDRAEYTLNIYRNKDRPLSMCVLDKGSFLAIASEGEMLSYAAGRAMTEEPEIYHFEAEKHYKFALPLGGKIEMPTVEDAPKFVSRSYSYAGGTVRHFGGTTYWNGESYGEAGADDQIPFTGPTNGERWKKTESSKDSRGQLILLPSSGHGKTQNSTESSKSADGGDGATTINIGGEWVTMDKLKKALSCGCETCLKTFGIEEIDTEKAEKMAIWRNGATDYVFVCAECMSEPPQELNKC